MAELPESELQRLRAMDAVLKRMRELDLVRQDAETGSFERGRELFSRWAEGTFQLLQDLFSKEEAERFEAEWTMHTRDSLPHYFADFSNYMEGLYRALQTRPEQVLRLEGPVIQESQKQLKPAAPATRFDRMVTWLKNRVVIAAILVIAITVIGLAQFTTALQNLRSNFLNRPAVHNVAEIYSMSLILANPNSESVTIERRGDFVLWLPQGVDNLRRLPGR